MPGLATAEAGVDLAWGDAPAVDLALLDVGGTWMRATLVEAGQRDASTVPLLVDSTPTGPSALAEKATALLQRLEAGGRSFDELRIAMPGAISADGRVRISGSLQIEEYALRDDLESRLGRPVTLVNDAMAQSLALGGPSETLVYVTIGTGLGGCIVINGVPVVQSGYAGEFGHMVVKTRRPETDHICYCGRTGCLELICSGAALERALGPAWWESGPAEQPERVLVEVGETLGRALDALVVALAPNRIHVAGRLTEHARFLDGVQDVFDASVHWPKPILEWSSDPTRLTFAGLCRIDPQSLGC